MADPIDTQNVFSKTVHVQKLQQTQLNQAANEQEGFADQMRKTSEDKLNKTQASEESVMQKTEDQREENKQQAEAKRREREEAEQEKQEGEKPKDGMRGRIIDVEI